MDSPSSMLAKQMFASVKMLVQAVKHSALQGLPHPYHRVAPGFCVA